MIKNIEMPKLAPTMSAGEVVKWHKQAGDVVQAEEVLLEVSTGKVTMEVEAQESGILKEILVQEKEKVDIGTAIACFEVSAETAEAMDISQQGGSVSIREITMPKLAPTMSAGEVVKWHKQAGDQVQAEEVLLEVSTGKVTMEVESQETGVLKEILVQEKEKVDVGALIAAIEVNTTDADKPEMAEISKKIENMSLNNSFDIVVIGGGPGGYVAAIHAAQAGAKTAVIEMDSLGGTCLNRGCIPTKALVYSADVYHKIEHASEFGVDITDYKVNYARMAQRKGEVVSQLVGGIGALMESNGVEVFNGRGKMISPNQIEIDMDGQKRTIDAEKIIIATGSRPARIPIPGIDEPGVMNSDDALELTELPKSIVIIGGGVIGMEMGDIFATLGSEVSIVEYAPRVLSCTEEEISLSLQGIEERKGMKFYTSRKVKCINSTLDGRKVVTMEDQDGNEAMVVGEKVLVSIGRALNTENIGLEELGIETLERGFIKVNDKMETNVPGIYAIGDIVPTLQLAHVASVEGMTAVDNALGKEHHIDYTAVPAAIFTSPEIADVGLTEEQAIEEGKENGYKVNVSRFPFAGNGKALSMGETEGIVKIIARADNYKILGAHIMGPHASDLISELTVAMENGVTAEQVAHTIHAHPTTAETIMECAHGIFGPIPHLPKQD